MNNKIAGAILLSASGLVTAIGAVGSQIAFAIVRGQFYVSKLSGEVPPGPENATLHWAVIIAVGVLAATGLRLIFRRGKRVTWGERVRANPHAPAPESSAAAHASPAARSAPASPAAH